MLVDGAGVAVDELTVVVALIVLAKCAPAVEPTPEDETCAPTDKVTFDVVALVVPTGIYEPFASFLMANP